MTTSQLLTKARSAVTAARLQADGDEKAAQIARRTGEAAKARLKQARRLTKLAKKSARKAEDRAEQSQEKLERALTLAEKLEKKLRKEQRKLAARDAEKTARAPQSGGKHSQKNSLPKAAKAKSRRRPVSALTRAKVNVLPPEITGEASLVPTTSPGICESGSGTQPIPDAI